MKYGYSKKVDLSFDEAIEKVTNELQNEGFGVLTDIDIKKTLKKKLDVDFRPYRILGACNPPAAYKALMTEEEIGLLLPCNIIVYENKENEIMVSATEVDALLSLVGKPEINAVAKDIKKKLHNVIDSL
ncbi:DUF302 domain-containing protein [candidate division KSB1 bacterium]|nr:DUF302 domain-containing protein [candidate division KSB1 bacterium]